MFFFFFTIIIDCFIKIFIQSLYLLVCHSQDFIILIIYKLYDLYILNFCILFKVKLALHCCVLEIFSDNFQLYNYRKQQTRCYFVQVYDSYTIQNTFIITYLSSLKCVNMILLNFFLTKLFYYIFSFCKLIYL